MDHCHACQRHADELTLLWDTHAYCRICLQDAGPDLAATARERSALECTIRPEQLSYKRCLATFMKLWTGTLLVLFIVPMVVVALQGKWDHFQFGLVFFLILFLFGLCFSGLGFWGRILNSRRQLPRTIRVADGEVTITTPKQTHCTPLASCDWLSGTSTYDEVVTMFLPIRPAIMLLTDHGRFTVTQEPAEVALWEAFLTLARPREKKPLGCGMMMLIGLAVSIGGGILGTLCGLLVERFWPQPFIVLSFAFLGFFDGIIFSALYASARNYGKTIRQETSLPLILLVLIFTGLKCFGMPGDWAIRGPLIVLHALVMTAALYLFIFRPLSRKEAEGASSSH